MFDMVFVLRILFWVFNVLCFFAGLGAFGLGSVLVNKSFDINVLLVDGQLKTVSIIFLVIGLAVVFISTLGCCGASNDSSVLLATYACALIIILVLQISVSILAFVYRYQLDSVVRKELEKQFLSFDKYKKGLDRIQVVQECCGLFGKHYWNRTDLPLSCCGFLESPNLLGPQKFCNLLHAHELGCTEVVIITLHDYLSTIGYIAILTGILETICILIVIVLLCVNDDDGD